MITKIIGTIFAGFAPAPKLSTPIHTHAADAVYPKRRRRSSLLTALLFILCLTTFSANAASTKGQLNSEITKAKSLLNSTAISLNGWEIPLGTSWASTATAGNLQNAITTAENVYNAPDKADYDSDIIALSDAQISFEKVLNPSGLKYDYTSLKGAIADAEEAISPAKFAVSANGLNVPGTKKWTSQSNLDAFKQKITAARYVITQYGEHGQSVPVATTNQVAINTAATLLGSQLSAFNGSITSGYMPDYSSLTTLIATATNLLQKTTVSVDGSDVPSSANWINQTMWNALNTAVSGAQSFVDNNTGATASNLSTNQGNVTTQEGILSTAVNKFNGGVGTGVGGPLLYNYLVLNAAIADAQAAIASITCATTGNNISPDALWAIPTYWDALNTLISGQIQGQGLQSTYGTAGNDPTTVATNQANINSKANELQTATATLRTNAQSGCKPDYSQLNSRILDAQTMLDDTPGSDDGHEYDATDFWALPIERTILQSAINVAQDHVDNNDLATHGNWSANQNAVDAAYSDLSAAYITFLSQRKSGDKYDPSDVSYTGLPAQILLAEDLLDSDDDNTEDVVSSTSFGADVAYGTKWLAVNVYTTLNTHLTDARSIVNTPSSFTKTHISNTYTSLSAAVTAATPQNGLGANPAELEDEIAAAGPFKMALDDGDVAASSQNGADIIYGKSWVTQTVATNLTTALTNALNASCYAPPTLHASAIVPLESALRSAINVFNPQLNPPYNALPDMTVLTNECDRIFAIVNALAASANGGADVVTSAIWVPAADKTALLNDIAAARLATYATHADVLAEMEDLNNALTALQASQAPGSKVSYILATPQTLPNGFVGAVYNAQVVNATLPNIAFSISSGALPDGLSLDASPTGITPSGTGKLAGKPTKAGTFTFTIRATHNSMTPAVTEALPHTVKIYDAPVITPTDYDLVETELVSVLSDIIIRFPSGVPMNTTVGTITLNNKQIRGYWPTDTTFVIPCPIASYEYETDYTLVVSGLESKDGLLTYGDSYTFRTRSTPPNPNIPRLVRLLPLSDGVTSDPLPGEHWINVDDKYNFTLKLTVPPDKTPTLTTNRIINGKTETVTGVPDPDMPETRFLFTVRDIHQTIEIRVVLSPRSPVGNEIVGDDVRIWAADGKLYVETPQPGRLSVYSITGVIHVRKSIAGSSTILLPKGVYIVRLNEKTYKVAVQ
jgi:hypothetical protein